MSFIRIAVDFFNGKFVEYLICNLSLLETVHREAALAVKMFVSVGDIFFPFFSTPYVMI